MKENIPKEISKAIAKKKEITKGFSVLIFPVGFSPVGFSSVHCFGFKFH